MGYVVSWRACATGIIINTHVLQSFCANSQGKANEWLWADRFFTVSKSAEAPVANIVTGLLQALFPVTLIWHKTP